MDVVQSVPLCDACQRACERTRRRCAARRCRSRVAKHRDEQCGSGCGSNEPIARKEAPLERGVGGVSACVVRYLHQTLPYALRLDASAMRSRLDSRDGHRRGSAVLAVRVRTHYQLHAPCRRASLFAAGPVRRRSEQVPPPRQDRCIRNPQFRTAPQSAEGQGPIKDIRPRQSPTCVLTTPTVSSDRLFNDDGEQHASESSASSDCPIHDSGPAASVRDYRHQDASFSRWRDATPRSASDTYDDRPLAATANHRNDRAWRSTHRPQTGIGRLQD